MIGTSATAVSPPKEYYRIIREICDHYNVLMIMDEVITGIGRTGKNFGIEHYGVTPDIIAVAKGLSGGYVPIGAVITSNKIFKAFYDGSGQFWHSFTFGGNPVSCAAANAVLKYIEDHDLVNRSEKMGVRLLSKLKERFDSHPIVGDIRGLGMLLGIEFVKNKQSREPFQPDARLIESLTAHSFEHGLIIVGGVRGTVDGVVGDHIQITPPFTLSENEADELVNKLELALNATMKDLEQLD